MRRTGPRPAPRSAPVPGCSSCFRRRRCSSIFCSTGRTRTVSGRSFRSRTSGSTGISPSSSIPGSGSSSEQAFTSPRGEGAAWISRPGSAGRCCRSRSCCCRQYPFSRRACGSQVSSCLPPCVTCAERLSPSSNARNAAAPGRWGCWPRARRSPHSSSTGCVSRVSMRSPCGARRRR